MSTKVTFLQDVVEARRIWGEKSSWIRDSEGDCKADRAWRCLLWSAAHEGMLLGKNWTEQNQNALESARLDYEKRSLLVFRLQLLKLTE